MIKLYHCRDARSFRCAWALEEMGLSYELETMPFPPRIECPDYLQINPIGTVPFFVDGNSRLTESVAILQYIVERYGPTSLTVLPDEPDYAHWLEWLHFGEATLTVPQAILLRYRFLKPEEGQLPGVALHFEKIFSNRLQAVDAALTGKSYLCSDRFTIADISVGYALMLSRVLQLDKYFSPSLQQYWERLSSRPAFFAAKHRQKVSAQL
jgi:glutathione S-transferase